MSFNPDRMGAGRARRSTSSASPRGAAARSPARSSAVSPRRSTFSYGTRGRDSTRDSGRGRQARPERARSRASSRERGSRDRGVGRRQERSPSRSRQSIEPPPPSGGGLPNAMSRAMARRSPAAAARGPRPEDGFDTPRSRMAAPPPARSDGRGLAAVAVRPPATPGVGTTPGSAGGGGGGFGGLGLAALQARLQGTDTSAGVESSPAPAIARTSSAHSRGWTSSGEDEWDDLSDEPEPDGPGMRGDRLRQNIRRELHKMTIGALNRKSLGCGIDQEALTNAQDHDSADAIKDALVELMMESVEFQITEPRFDEAQLADMEDEIREELEPMSLGKLVQRAQRGGEVSEEAILDAQDSSDPQGALVDLLVEAEAQAKVLAEQTGAAIRLQANYRGWKGRLSFEKKRADKLLAEEQTEEEAREERKRQGVARELEALRGGDSIFSLASETSGSRSLLLSADQKVSMLHSPGNTRNSSIAEGLSLSAEGFRRTERVAAELFALRQASDEGQAERSIYTGRSHVDLSSSRGDDQTAVAAAGSGGGGETESSSRGGGHSSRSSALRAERSIHTGHGSDMSQTTKSGQRGRVSGIQAELARRERAVRKSALEQEVAMLKQSFQRRLAGDGSAGEVVLDPSLGDLSASRSIGGGGAAGDFSMNSAVSGGGDVPKGTPRQRVWAAERRRDKRLETQAREGQSVVKMQAMVRGQQARKKTHRRMARKREAYSVQVFDGRFHEERKLRDAGLLD